MAIFGRIKPVTMSTEHEGSQRLAKTLSWPHLIALGVGAIVGTGIYTLTGVGASLAGPAVILSFAIAGLVCACAALAYAEMATMIPMAGSAYTYTYSSLGEVFAWIVGWALILEYSLACSTVAVGWSAHLVGWLEGGIGLHLPPALLAGPFAGGIVNLPAVLVSLAVMGLLLLGARESATVNIILVIIKLVALTAFVVIGLPAIKSGNYHPFMPFGFVAHEVGPDKFGVMAAAAIVFFAFYGFDAVSTSAEEVKNPGRDLTIGIIGSMLLCTLIYMLVAVTAVGVLPFKEIADSGEPLPHILRSLNHPLVAALVGGAAIVALPSVILVMMYGQSRIFFVMSRDGLLPKVVSQLNAKGSPVLITILTGIFIAIFAGFVPLKKIAELSNAGTLIAFVAVSLSMIILRIKAPELKRDFKTPVYWLIGPAAILGCMYLFYSLPTDTKMFSLYWMLIGLAFYGFYGFWHSRLRKKNS